MPRKLKKAKKVKVESQAEIRNQRLRDGVSMAVAKISESEEIWSIARTIALASAEQIKETQKFVKPVLENYKEIMLRVADPEETDKLLTGIFNDIRMMIEIVKNANERLTKMSGKGEPTVDDIIELNDLTGEYTKSLELAENNVLPNIFTAIEELECVPALNGLLSTPLRARDYIPDQVDEESPAEQPAAVGESTEERTDDN